MKTNRSMTLAYLTSAYARASDTFIRGEVAQLRALGHTVHTFSIRRPAPGELIDEEVRRERAATEDIVAAGPARLAWATLREALRTPRGVRGGGGPGPAFRHARSEGSDLAASLPDGGRVPSRGDSAPRGSSTSTTTSVKDPRRSRRSPLSSPGSRSA